MLSLNYLFGQSRMLCFCASSSSQPNAPFPSFLVSLFLLPISLFLTYHWLEAVIFMDFSTSFSLSYLLIFCFDGCFMQPGDVCVWGGLGSTMNFSGIIAE